VIGKKKLTLSKLLDTVCISDKNIALSIYCYAGGYRSKVVLVYYFCASNTFLKKLYTIFTLGGVAKSPDRTQVPPPPTDLPFGERSS
jgi:hypothetical protein